MVIRAHKTNLLSEVILFILYQEALSLGEELENGDIIDRLDPIKISVTLVSFALEELKQRNLIDHCGDYRKGRLSISKSGFSYVQYRLTLPDSAIYKFSKSDSWLLEDEQPGDDAPLIEKGGDAIPASDRIVKQSDNEEAWSGAVESTKELEAALVKSNDHGDLSDEEYEQRLNEVRALQIMLDSPQVQWDALNQFAEKTVKYLAVKFADNAVGNVASALTRHLMALLAL